MKTQHIKARKNSPSQPEVVIMRKKILGTYRFSFLKRKNSKFLNRIGKDGHKSRNFRSNLLDRPRSSRARFKICHVTENLHYNWPIVIFVDGVFQTVKD